MFLESLWNLKTCKNVFIVSAIITTVLSLYTYSKTSRKEDVAVLTRIESLRSNGTVVHIAMSSCGNRVGETHILIKSAVLLSTSTIKFHIFTETFLRTNISAYLDHLKQTKFGNFTYELHDNWFPEGGISLSKSWRNLFRPCASQRLFLHRCLPGVDAVIYVDTDTLFLSPPQITWGLFRNFNASHIVGMAPNQVTNVSSFYDMPNTVPHYGEKGLNSGVMLINLTRLRSKPWEDDLANYYLQHKERIQLGDQDLLNVYFHHRPAELYQCPCGMNYRSDYCFKTFTCQLPPRVLHGNRFVWHTFDEPAFRAVFEAFKSHNMESPLSNILTTVCANLKAAKASRCGEVSDLFVEELSRSVESNPEFQIDQKEQNRTDTLLKTCT